MKFPLKIQFSRNLDGKQIKCSNFLTTAISMQLVEAFELSNFLTFMS